MSKKFSIELCSDLDFEGMVIDISYDNQTIASISYDRGLENTGIKFFPYGIFNQNQSYPFEAFFEALRKSKDLSNQLIKESDYPNHSLITDKFDITIASLSDRENLVAEICYDNARWAEISQETDELMVQFYSYPGREYWEFDLDETLRVLKIAKIKLFG